MTTVPPLGSCTAVLPEEANPEDQYTASVDIFAFGLCVLELATLQRMDRDYAAQWPALLETVANTEARDFIQRCAANSGIPRGAACPPAGRQQIVAAVGCLVLAESCICGAKDVSLLLCLHSGASL